jgi:hypothetical protein
VERTPKTAPRGAVFYRLPTDRQLLLVNRRPVDYPLRFSGPVTASPPAASGSGLSPCGLFPPGLSSYGLSPLSCSPNRSAGRRVQALAWVVFCRCSSCHAGLREYTKSTGRYFPKHSLVLFSRICFMRSLARQCDGGELVINLEQPCLASAVASASNFGY